MAPRHDVKDVAGFCEARTGERGGVSTVVFPNGSRAKWPSNTVKLVPSMVAAAEPGEWFTCDLCDRVRPLDQKNSCEEGVYCDTCAEEARY